MSLCFHRPKCPSSTASDRSAARVVASHPEQGWSLLCNGIVLFDDAGAILPDGTTTPGYGSFEYFRAAPRVPWYHAPDMARAA